MMIFQYGQLKVRLINENDIPFIVKWLSDQNVLQYYEGRDNPFDEEKVRSVFLNKEEWVTMCIVEYEDKEIGYIQFYELDDDGKVEYGYKNTSEKLYGMDQFIGEVDYWNKGIGSQLISAMIDYLTKNLHADKVVMDPQTWNERAIACYMKCGFKIVKCLPKHEFHEGEFRDCYVMEYCR